MSLVLAVLTSHPGLLGCELRRLEGQVEVEAPGARARGAGLSVQGDVLLQRYPPGTALQVGALAPREEAEALVFQAAELPLGLGREENLQPFRFRQWLFAYHGPAQGVGGARAALLASLPQYLQRMVRGETDGELLFLHFLAAVGEVERTMLPAADVARALQRALERLRNVSAGATASAVATNGRVLAAACGGAPLRFTVLEGSERCEACGLTGEEGESDARGRAHRRRRSVVVASHVVHPAGWEALEPGAALAVDASLQVQHVPAH